ncbi:MAG: dihydrolipoyl dehydrogenase [Nitrospirae bacterium]|nr:MAG: dihydrolipoyl dehydrogenase [Nitrospirota bacterium]
MPTDIHIAILGAGPGGYVAAIRAAQYGARVTVIEREALGGMCLNWGCIPSKALLSVVELGEKVRKAEAMGLRIHGAVTYDLPRMIQRKNDVVGTLVKGIATLFRTWGIVHLQGTGRLVNERTIHVAKPDGSETTVQADAIILATGTNWPNLPMFPIDGKHVLTSKEALDLTRVPETILIVGGGVEGCEFACLFSGLGARVTVVEMMPTVLPFEDEEVSAFLTRELKRRGVEVLTGTTVAHVGLEKGLVHAELSSGQRLDAEIALISIGRTFNTAGIGLDAVGVQLGPRGEVAVDERMQTTVPGIYAIGDLVGKAMLAHVASAQGKVAVANILGRPIAFDERVIPAGIFTLPEIGRVGLTEQQAREQGRSVVVGRFKYAGLGKGHAVDETTGLFKVIADAGTKTILGVHIVGTHATDLVHEAALAMQMGATADTIGSMIHAHPTFAEGLMEAAEDVEGFAIHQARKRI